MTGGQISGFGWAVASPHHLATGAAGRILDQGGNAVDAAVAANAVLGVVAPETCGIGGDLFALVHLPGGDKPACLNASGRAGSGADAESLRAQGYTRIPYTHPASVTVPGCVDGWQELLDRYGSMGLPDVLAPALRHAEDGFPASDELAGAVERMFPRLRDQASAAALLPDGSPPAPDAELRRPDLARTLGDVAAGGRAGFYEGAAGAAICQATAGIITPRDLLRTQAEWVDPLGLDLGGLRAWTTPPNSQGYLTLAASWLFEWLEPPDDFEDPLFTHLLVEAFRAVSWERDDSVSDPDGAMRTPSDLVGPARLGERLTHILPDSRAVWPEATVLQGETAYLCTVDPRGVGVSLIQSNFTGLGSGIGAGEAGFLLHNRGAGFDLRPGHPNELSPGRRPLHTLSPTLWTEGADLRMLLGTRGGYHQPQLLIQAIAQLLHLRRQPGAAQAAPRWIIADDGDLHVEGAFPARVVSGLRERGHRVVVAEPLQPGWGPISMITVSEHSLRTASADPRVDTAQAMVG